MKTNRIFQLKDREGFVCECGNHCLPSEVITFDSWWTDDKLLAQCLICKNPAVEIEMIDDLSQVTFRLTA